MALVTNYALNLASAAFGREPVRPLMFCYNTTYRCELGCRYCCDGESKRQREDPCPELTTDDAKRLVTILRRAADTLYITGGEPMIRRDLEEVIDHARGSGFRVVLNTRGIGLEERADLVRLVDVLVLSVDSLDPASLADIMRRPRETAERVLGALRFAMSERRRAGTRLAISAVAMPGSIDDVAGVLRFAAKHSLGFQISPEFVGEEVNPLLRGNERYKRLVDRFLRTRRLPLGLCESPRYVRGIREFEPSRCSPLLVPMIRPDGRIPFPCFGCCRFEMDVLATGSYRRSLAEARRQHDCAVECDACCYLIHCMAITLVQRHPFAALGELLDWTG